jgi:hypothetical protein
LIGGQEYGHKGFGLALMIEALSPGPVGHGRKDAPTRWGGNVSLQLIDPAHFAAAKPSPARWTSCPNAAARNRPIDAKRAGARAGRRRRARHRRCAAARHPLRTRQLAGAGQPGPDKLQRAAAGLNPNLRESTMPQLKPETTAKLMTVSTATLCTALFKRGLRNQFIQDVRPLNASLPNMVGEAFTLRYIPAREDLNPITCSRTAPSAAQGGGECPPAR